MFNAQPFAAGIGSSFNADSVALSSDRTSRDTVKILNEVKSPLIQMSEFFSGIDSGIIKLVEIAKKSLGLDKESLQLESRIADIMASDLALEEKKNLTAQLRGRDANLAGQDTDEEPGEKPVKIGFLDSLREAFDDLTKNQTVGELFKILLLATGALALAKFATRFNDKVAGVLKFVNETLFPELKELNNDIDSYQGLGGLTKLGLFAKIGTAFAAIPLAIGKIALGFTNITKRIKSAQACIMLNLALFKQNSFFQSISNFFKAISPRIKALTSSFKDGLKAFSKISGISALMKIGGLFLRFIAWPLQVAIGLFSGLTAGLKKFTQGGNVFQVLGAFMVGVYDAIIGSTLNLIGDVAGWVVKKLGFETLGKSIQDMDFTFDGIMTSIINLKNIIGDFLKNSINSVKSLFTGKEYEKIDTPKVISKSQAKNAIVNADEKITNEIETTKTINDNKLINIEKVESKDLVLNKETNVMAMKTEMLKSTIAASSTNNGPAGGATMMIDNKSTRGGDVINNSKVVSSNQNVEHSDRATKELNAVYGYASA